MSGWRRPHFLRPYLAADVDTSCAGVVVLRDDDRTLELTVDGDHGAAAALLRSLSDPTSVAWDQLAANGEPSLGVLVADLDRLGWLRDADVSGRDRLVDRARSADELCDRASRWLAGADRLPAASGDDLAAEVLVVCRRRWERTSPVAGQILTAVIDGRRDDRWDAVGLVVTDPVDLERQVWAGVVLTVISRHAARAMQHQRHIPAVIADGPGINVLVQAEACIEAFLGAQGPLAFSTLIESSSGAASIAPLVYQHRWYETIHYVDALTGLLRVQLGARLRDLVHGYLAEEVGHEIHEVEACAAVGVTVRDLDGFAPLPWFAAYPELLGGWAESRPLSFLLAITVAEGMPGAGERLTERLAAHGDAQPEATTAHDQIDRQLDHEMVTRALLTEVDWVGGDDARAAVSDVLRLVEVTTRGWAMLARYAAAGLPRTPRAFEISPDILLDLEADVTA